MDMLRITARWSGFSGAPGYSNFYFAGGGGLISDAQQVNDRVGTAFEELTTSLPSGVVIESEPEAVVIDSVTGISSDFQAVDPFTVTATTTGGNYAGPAGAVVTWRTNDVRFGRRIRGRTFIVPLSTNAYEGDGTLTESTIFNLRDFADVLTTWDFDSEFGVWSRPRDGDGGVFATVTSSSVPDRVAVLRSRRD